MISWNCYWLSYSQVCLFSSRWLDSNAEDGKIERCLKVKGRSDSLAEESSYCTDKEPTSSTHAASAETETQNEEPPAGQHIATVVDDGQDIEDKSTASHEPHPEENHPSKQAEGPVEAVEKSDEVPEGHNDEVNEDVMEDEHKTGPTDEVMVSEAGSPVPPAPPDELPEQTEQDETGSAQQPQDTVDPVGIDSLPEDFSGDDKMADEADPTEPLLSTTGGEEDGSVPREDPSSAASGPEVMGSSAAAEEPRTSGPEAASDLGGSGDAADPPKPAEADPENHDSASDGPLQEDPTNDPAASSRDEPASPKPGEDPRNSDTDETDPQAGNTSEEPDKQTEAVEGSKPDSPPQSPAAAENAPDEVEDTSPPAVAGHGDPGEKSW